MRYVLAMGILAAISAAMLLFPCPVRTLHPGCDAALLGALEQWSQATGQPLYPNVEGDSGKSLSVLTNYMQASYWLAHYGYVPGLHEEDLDGHILYYFKERTILTSHGERPRLLEGLRRQKKWLVYPGSYGHGTDSIDTPEFKARLLRTLEFLQTNNRPYWTNTVREHTLFLNSITE